jgi:hypothetical protein
MGPHQSGPGQPPEDGQNAHNTEKHGVETTRQSEAENEAERRNLRRLQLMMDMVLSVLSQDPDLTRTEALEMATNCKTAALALFPDKELAFDLIYQPRLQRVINERFRVN